MPQSLISVVSPVYRAKSIVPELVRRIVVTLSEITEDFEIILVEDGCPEGSWESIAKECEKDNRVKGVKLSRNFGQHYAITAGLDAVSGEWIVVMDCDLQDQPEEIPQLYQKVSEGFDFIQARRVSRKDKWVKRMTSGLFHSVYKYFSGFKSDQSVANFGIYHQKVIQAVLEMREFSRSFPSLLQQVGFYRGFVDVDHAPRISGESSYSWSKLINLSLDVILSNSNKPLKLTVKLGFIISFFSFLLAIYNVIAQLSGLIKVPGYTSTIFSIWFVGGLILLVLGVLGLYIGKIFDQVKGRPLYLVSDRINLHESN